jgi:hypothetical protein
VKSANVGLAVDFCPKLLDCGLAKFIPETDPAQQAQTVFTKTGMTFGTPGYMCNQYVNTGVYSAKSEVYAFGILLAELYGGRVQNQDGVMIEDEALTADEIVPDVRIDSALDLLTQRWKDLSINCIRSYRSRIATMMPVMRELRGLYQEHFATAGAAGAGGGYRYASMEEEMNQLRRELEEVRLKESIEQRVQREDSARDKRACLQCYDEFGVAQGVQCPRGHFFCDECFRGDNLTHQLSAETRGAFVANGAKLACQWCPAPPHVFQGHDIASHLGTEGYGRYRAAQNEVVEVGAFRRAEGQFQQRLESMRAELAAAAAAAGAEQRQQRVARHRLHIAEHILTLKCPRTTCRRAIYDFEGCFAVPCSCGCGFCGWCLQDNGQASGSLDANHQHVKQCTAAPTRRRGGYYGNMAEFNAVHVVRRQEAARRYLQSEVAEGDREALRQAIAQDFRDVGAAMV